MSRQIVLALALELLGVAAARAADHAKAELKKLQGEWPVVAKETHGHDLLSKTEELKIVFDGDKMIFKIKEVVVEGGLPVRMKSRDGASYSVKLDPSASPKAADLTLLGDGPRKGEVIPAIYHLDEDQLWICLGMGGTRPGDFVTRRMPDRMVYKCKRPKPPSEGAVKGMKKLAGTWVGVSVEAAGKP